MLSDINTYDIVNSEVLVLTESAAKIFADDVSIFYGMKLKIVSRRINNLIS